MAAELVTPVDELTGLPYPIAPNDRLWLPLDNPDVANEHHAFHPFPEYTSVAEIALRNARIQIVPVEYHNLTRMAYHRFYKGPEKPTDEADIFRRVVYACAGYVPLDVIDLSSGEPVERPSTKTERRHFLVHDQEDVFSNRYFRYGYGPIRDFFTNYLLQQSDMQVDESVIEQFLTTKSPDIKLQLGMQILWSAAEIATDGDLRTTYAEFRRRRLLHPLMPEEPRDLVMYKTATHLPDRFHERVAPKLERRVEQLVA